MLNSVHSCYFDRFIICQGHVCEKTFFSSVFSCVAMLSFCFQAEVTQRLSNKPATGRAAGLQSHEELARKLQVMQLNFICLPIQGLQK